MQVNELTSNQVWYALGHVSSWICVFRHVLGLNNYFHALKRTQDHHSRDQQRIQLRNQVALGRHSDCTLGLVLGPNIAQHFKY